MRFRYFDSDGTEVEISSVDALKFRIGTGAVSPDTLLYDSAVQKWAPAGRHPIFRFIVEEDESVLPESSRRAWLEMADEEPVEPDVRGAAADPEPLPVDPEPLAAEPEPLPDPGPAAAREPTAPEPEAAPPSEPETAPPSEPDAAGPLPAARDPEPTAADPTSTVPEPEAPEVPAGPPPEQRPSSDPRVRELDIPVPIVRRPPAVEDAGGAPDQARPGAGRWSVLAALLVLGAGALLVHRADLGSDVRAADGAEAPAIGVARAVPTASSSSSESSSPVPVVAATARGDRAEPLTSRELESLAREVAGAVSGDLAVTLADLEAALGVPARPPEAWLEGEYLAGADRHPEVREYWRAYGAYVTAVRTLEEDLYRGFVQNRVLKMGLDTASAGSLSARVLERYEAAAGDRQRVYDDLEALAAEAVALHDTLAFRSDAISHEPFSGRRLSRDPVVEAVADDPELAAEIWTRLDRIFERLERLQGLGPVSTLRLQEALLSGLRSPDRES